MTESMFQHKVACTVTIKDLMQHTKWCRQNIGDWLTDWYHLYDPKRKVYWYCFSTEDDLAYFQLACC